VKNSVKTKVCGSLNKTVEIIGYIIGKNFLDFSDLFLFQVLLQVLYILLIIKLFQLTISKCTATILP